MILNKLKDDRIIKEFKKRKNELFHPLFPKKEGKSTISMGIGLLTLGHLWLYELVEEHGYSEFLKQIVEYAIYKKSALFEWEIDESVEKEISSILAKYNIAFSKKLLHNFNIKQYSDIDSKAKDKDHPYCHLTRLLALAELGMASEIYSLGKLNFEEFLCKPGSVINATYLMVPMLGKEKEIIEKVPNWFYELIEKNMGCYYEHTHFRYYPKDGILNKFEDVEHKFMTRWYMISDDDQVIISKLLYSIRIIKELSLSLMAINGILSAVSTRIIFDNYWQTLYLLRKHEVDKYRSFVLKRMRLHILKRDDGSDVNIGELLRQVEGGLLDPIPVNGDYFTKSAREYAIELNIKDDYDKYYEYNSEFIHASLTAVYSGIMIPCENPEHDFHLTIKDGGSRLIDCIKDIFDILNKHIDLINTYYDDEIVDKFDVNEMFFFSREEWVEYMNKSYIN